MIRRRKTQLSMDDLLAFGPHGSVRTVRPASFWTRAFEALMTRWTTPSWSMACSPRWLSVIPIAVGTAGRARPPR
jgi:hypothetical protein